MKRTRWLFFIGSIILILVTITATIEYFIFHIDNGDDTILFYENDGCRIYVDEETKDKLSNESFFNQSRKTIEIYPEVNETIARSIALKFFDAPVLNQYNSDNSRFWYDDENSGGQIIIDDKFSYSVYLSEENVLSKERIADDELKRIAEDLILKHRGNIDDLKLLHISCSKVSEGNDRTRKETFLGYSNYIIIFSQYIEGIKVTGERGDIRIGIDPYGRPNAYHDTTISEFNLIVERSSIFKPERIFDKFSNGEGNDKSITLEDIDLVFNLHSSNAYIEYELELRSRTKYHSMETVYMLA